MNMQDRELDNLFRNKLEKYEVEPSAQVWTNITNELSTERKRRSLAPYLSVAASVIVLISAGLLFWPKDKITNGPKPIAMNSKPKPAVEIDSNLNAMPLNAVTPARSAASFQPKKITAAIVNHAAVIMNTNTSPVSTPATTQTIPDPSQQNYAAVDHIAKTEIKPVVPDMDLSGKLPEVLPAISQRPVSVLAVANTADADTKQPAVKKRKIRGLGSLINAAVSLVDSRSDKLIEFTDTDEGDTLTGINLGIIKVKKVQ